MVYDSGVINGVPNQRNPDQTLITCAVDYVLLSKLDAASSKVSEDRSVFVRKALIARIRENGIEIDDALAFPPGRVKPRIPPVKGASDVRYGTSPKWPDPTLNDDEMNEGQTALDDHTTKFKRKPKKQ